MNKLFLIIDPSDIFYLMKIRSHDVGQFFLILEDTKKTDKIWSIKTVFCDPRTSGYFRKFRDENHLTFDICDNPREWENWLQKWMEYFTDPDYLTQTLKEKYEWFWVKIVMEKSPIGRIRIVKSPEEIQLLKISQSLNKKVYEKILPYLIVGVTEEEIARKIQIFQLELWFSGPSFPPIVAFGENSAIPHHSSTDRKLQKWEWILIDMGGIYQGYCSDMTRCLRLEDKVQEQEEEQGWNSKKMNNGGIYTLLQNIVDTIIPLAKPGMKVADLDKKTREMLWEYESYFIHSLGHGVGIDIHEKPFLSSKSDDILQAWMVVTLEPGVYFSWKYGARYEEMCVVTANGMERI